MAITTVSELARTVAAQGARQEAHGTQLDTLQGDVHAIRKSQAEIVNAIGELSNRITTQTVTQEANKQPSMRENFQMIREIGQFVAICAFCIGYVVTNMFGAQAAVASRDIAALTVEYQERRKTDAEELSARRKAERDQMAELRRRFTSLPEQR